MFSGFRMERMSDSFTDPGRNTGFINSGKACTGHAHYVSNRARARQRRPHSEFYGGGLVAPFVVVVRHPLLSLETSLSHNSLASIMTSFCREVLGCCREDARTP